MALLYNLARVTSATTGTGTITLGAAVPGFLTFANAGVANGQVVAYGIKDGVNSEVGSGLYSTAGPTLTRNVSNSTNAGTAINLSGLAEVYITARSQDIVNKAGDAMTGALTLPADPTLALHAATKQYVDSKAVIISDTPPAGAADNSLWWESDSGLLYLRFNDGTSTQWVIAAPQPDFSVLATKAEVAGALHYDAAQTLTAAQQQQARQNVYAAPFDALAYNGMQINGGCDVSQELGTGSTTTTGYVRDGWIAYWQGGMALGAGTGGSIAPGFANSVYVNVTTAKATLTGTDQVLVMQHIEGYRVARLAWGTASASPITIAFWSKHHRIGTYSVCVRNLVVDRSYVTTYTHAVADVAQYNVITVPGCVDGTWNTDSTAAMSIIFSFGMGTSFVAPTANTWLNAAYLAMTGQVNAVAATSDISIITGLIVVPGNEAPPAARSPFIMRPYGNELTTCQRYYQRLGGQQVADILVQGYGMGGYSVSYTLGLPVAMRAIPAVAAVGSWTRANTSGQTFYASTTAVAIQVNITATGAADFYTNGGYLALNARF